MSHRLTIAAAVLLAGVGLTFVFWLPLWLGGGFVGGDVYSYYFPQKVFFAERLHAGEFPLWNNRTGFGYPLIGESQTGAFYPFHLFWYYFFDINTAYNAEHLLHYVLAFVFTTMYAQRFGLKLIPSLFVGLVYTYAWFPSRCCVEWAIIGGAWLPAALWCAESFLQIRLWRYAIGLSAVLAVQMLAGHFQIAFMTQLVLLTYVPLRLWFTDDVGIRQEVSQTSEMDHTERIHYHRSARWPSAIVLSAAMLFGFALAAIQLLPTWELKQHSQRVNAGEHHELDFGSIPVWYWSQMVRPWHWYSPLVDRNHALRESPPGEGSRTHEIEAHLYFGLVPLVLVFIGFVSAVIHRNRKLLIWIGFGVMALCYTPGWFLPITEHLPGFSFFQGPGRFGIVTTFAVAVLAGSALDDLLSRKTLSMGTSALIVVATITAAVSVIFLQGDVEFAVGEQGAANPLIFGHQAVSEGLVTSCLSIWMGAAVIGLLLGSREGAVSQTRIVTTGKVLFVCAIFAVTVSDLWIVSRLITTSFMIANPPINHLAESPVRQKLMEFEEQSGQPARLFAPGANFPNVLGVSSLPVYLTFGPKEYPEIVEPLLERRTDENSEDPLDKRRLQLFADWGLTHVLSFEPFARNSFALKNNDVKLIWQGDDPVVNRAMGRSGQPLFLYALAEGANSQLPAHGRVHWEFGSTTGSEMVPEYHANRVTIDAVRDIDSDGKTPLVLTDLMYPGWKVFLDGKPATSTTHDGLFRAVEVPAGEHTVVWKYEPRSVYWGAIVSIASLILLAAIAHICFWHPTLFNSRKV